MKDSHIRNKEFYKGRRVFVTGHTGFKGAWLSAILQELGAKAMGYALTPEKGCLYEKISGDRLIQNVTGDLLDAELLKKVIHDFQPEVVLHMAAFGFVKECYDDPVRAYITNLVGSMNLLQAVRDAPSAKAVVMVSTDKVYENKGDGAVYRVGDPLGGMGPYSASKTCMEILAADYRKTYFLAEGHHIGLATARASNVLGGGDHVETRLIPSILNAVAKGNEAKLRNPSQTRPWQSVLDALNGYLTIGRYLYQAPETYSGAWNIGPTVDGIRSVSYVFEKIQDSFSGLQGKKGDSFRINESETLGLDIRKTMEELEWEPLLTVDRTISLVVDFFKCQKNGEPEYEIVKRQIKEFFGGNYEYELEK